MSALTLTQITAYLLAVSAVVAALISQIVKPLLERIPALSPTAADQTLHDTALRLANLVLTTAAVLVLAVVNHQVAAANLVPTVAAIIAASLGSHATYALVASKKSGSATVTLVSALSAAPLHRQSPPPAPVDAI